ncbi:folate family ECF transporter S component [Garciella nitratireducens]|uniref:ECF transporter S component, folate family n=1 Tax=Garciella nitratireducens DSM 15102 TaxID=1121911 RepID=A0A1T4LH92_9FIRM|nr:folate family ECF transporter S component [Garciella nitratireducens]RBP46803.1 ECF transporter S component (folate family) [Garciella nitratireducens]SJZ53986.1 ECF transporter S component, folate family [Garciella nitratireducens DSM 15102]
MNKTHNLVFIALLIALEIILTRFIAIQTPIIRIGFGFIPIALSSIFFGPIIGGITAALSDLLGMLIFPKGAYFPGFTFSAFLSGVIYGRFLYNKSKAWFNIVIAVFLNSIIVDLGLNTLWLSIITGNPFMVIITPRIIKEAILIPIRIVLIYITWHSVGEYIQKNLLSFSKH